MEENHVVKMAAARDKFALEKKQLEVSQLRRTTWSRWRLSGQVFTREETAGGKSFWKRTT